MTTPQVPHRRARRVFALTATLVLFGTGARAADAPAAADVAAATAAAAPVTIVGSVEPDTVTIGTRFRYTVAIDAAAGLEVVLSQPTERIGEFDIVDFGDAPVVERAGRRIVTRWYTLVGWEPGYKLLTSPLVQYRRPDGTLVAAATDDTVVTVESLLADDVTDIRDIKEPEAVPTDWRPYWLAGGTLLVLAALGAGLFWLLNRRHRPAPAPPQRPAHEIAYAELARLRKLGLVQQGAFKEYYSGLSSIVRSYVELRFGVRAPEMTTEEFLMQSARRSVLQGAHRGLLAGFLGESDLVKFARHHPTIDDSERAYDAAKRFVDETAAAARQESDAAR